MEASFEGSLYMRQIVLVIQPWEKGADARVALRGQM